MNEAKLIKLQTNQLIDGMKMLNLSVEKAATIMSYLQLLQKWNQTYNLTAITQLEDMVTHHALDALAVVAHYKGHSIIDVGTGGGIPGFILAIMFPNKNIHLLDSVGKKARFMRHVKRELNLTNTTIIHSRVENFIPEEKFDVVTSRAFSEMGQFLSLTAHLVKDEGCFLAMKGPRPEPLATDMPFQVQFCWDIQVPFLDESRKLYQIIKT